MRAAVVRNNPVGDSVEVAVWVPMAHGFPATVVTQLSVEGAQIEPVEPQMPPPTLMIPNEIARALLDALAEYYGGTGDYRQLRRDFEHERSRVDSLIAALIDLGKGAV